MNEFKNLPKEILKNMKSAMSGINNIHTSNVSQIISESKSSIIKPLDIQNLPLVLDELLPLDYELLLKASKKPSFNRDELGKAHLVRLELLEQYEFINYEFYPNPGSMDDGPYDMVRIDFTEKGVRALEDYNSKQKSEKFDKYFTRTLSIIGTVTGVAALIWNIVELFL